MLLCFSTAARPGKPIASRFPACLPVVTAGIFPTAFQLRPANLAPYAVMVGAGPTIHESASHKLYIWGLSRIVSRA